MKKLKNPRKLDTYSRIHDKKIGRSDRYERRCNDCLQKNKKRKTTESKWIKDNRKKENKTSE